MMGQNRLGHALEISRAGQPGKRQKTRAQSTQSEQNRQIQCDGAEGLLADAWASKCDGDCAGGLLADAWASRKQGLYMLCSSLPRRKIMCGVNPPRAEIQRFTGDGSIH